MDPSIALSFLATLAKISGTILALYFTMIVFLLRKPAFYKLARKVLFFSFCSGLFGLSAITSQLILDMHYITINNTVDSQVITRDMYGFFVVLGFIAISVILLSYGIVFGSSNQPCKT